MDRRQLLKSGGLAAAAVTAGTFSVPHIALGNPHSDELFVGSGEFKYQVHHDYFELPEKYTYQTTHNVAVDSDGLVYFIHEGDIKQKNHPSIFVFDPAGKFVRAFGSEFQGGGHGLEIRNEGGEDFLYVCAYKSLKKFAKLTTKGEMVWERKAPMDSGRYAAGEDTNPTGQWGRDRFLPTNFAFLDDGGFLLVDGYGAFAVHRYDKDANYVSTFGKIGKEDGQFQTPHGIWIDRRDPKQERIVVADRANMRLQWLSMEGEHIRTQPGFLLPANVDTRGKLMLVPELQARITILDENNAPVAKLGDDEDWRKQVLGNGMRLRRTPKQWQDGKFLHPHDACFDAEGNILVAEWVSTGRVTKLSRV